MPRPCCSVLLLVAPHFALSVVKALPLQVGRQQIALSESWHATAAHVFVLSSTWLASQPLKVSHDAFFVQSQDFWQPSAATAFGCW